MRCEEAREHLSELEPREIPADELAAHLEACSACAAERAFLDGLDREVQGAVAERAPARLPLPVVLRRRPFWPWAAAAVLLLLAGGLWMHWGLEPGSPSPPAPLPPPGRLRPAPGGLALLPGGGRLELSGEAQVRLSGDGEVLTLSQGRCWLETGDRAMHLETPFPLRVSPFAEVELRVLDGRPTLASLLLGQALAEEGSFLEVSVLAGSVEGAGLRLRAGQKARLGADGIPAPTPLGEADRIRIEGWRAERLEGVAARHLRQAWRLEPGIPLVLPVDEVDPAAPRVLVVRICSTGAHLLFRDPGVAEASIGNLPALKDGAWHRLAIRAGNGRVEAFLDGRRILRSPAVPAEGAAGFSLTALGAAVELKDLRTGWDAR